MGEAEEQRTAPVGVASLVSREQWGALGARGTVGPDQWMTPLRTPVGHVVFTYSTGTPVCHTPDACCQAVRLLQLRAFDQGLPDIPYNFIVGGDDQVYVGRGWDAKPEPHPMFPDLSDDSIEVAFIGDYTAATLEYGMVRSALELTAGEGVRSGRVLSRYELVESVAKLNFPPND